jgi:hypothetical protein
VGYNPAIVRIAYRVSEKDSVDAYDLFAASGSGRYSRRSLPWVGACGLGAEAYYLIVQPRRDIILIVAGFAVSVSLLFYRFGHRQWFRGVYRKDHRFKHEFTADISDEGIHIITPFSDSLVKWNAFVRYLEGKDIFTLCVSEGNFFIFPKRAFAQGEDAEFRSLLQRKVGSTV